MSSWLSNIAQEAGEVIAAYPALLILVALIFIAAALLWVWFRVPVASSDPDDRSIWVSLFEKIKTTYATITRNVRQLFIHARAVVNANYEVPLYLVLNPIPGQHLIRTMPASKTRRILSKTFAELFRDQTQDQVVIFDNLVLYDLAVIEPEHLNKVVRKIESKRPQRPIDGILIVLPAQLIGTDDTQGVIENLGAALKTIDCDVPFLMPVYVVVSQCNSVRGFDIFAGNNAQHQNEMFGWSNHLDLKMPYRRGLVEMAFESLTSSIKANQVRKSALDAGPHKAEDFLLADLDLVQLKEKVVESCDLFFHDTPYSNGYYFRGLYFIGDNGAEYVAQGGEENLFLHDLLQHKIAAEANLAAPTQSGHAAHSRFLSRYKKASIIAFSILCGVGAWSLWSVNAQFKEVSSAINQINDPSLISGSGYGEVARVLNKLSDVDARSFVRLALPISWFSNAEDSLIETISEQKFGRIVFPVLHCRIAQNFSALRNLEPVTVDGASGGSFSWSYAGVWLNNLENFQSARSRFIELSEPSRSRDKAILTKFSALIRDLYGIELASGFFKRNDLYRVALEKLDYNFEAKNQRCPNGSTGVDTASSDLFWSYVNTQASAIYTHIQSSSLSPAGEIEVAGAQTVAKSISALGSEPASADVAKLAQWFDYIESNWIGDGVTATPCQKLYRRLSVVDAGWVYGSSQTAAGQADKAVALFNKQQCDQVFFKQLLNTKLAFTSKPFVQSSDDGAIEFGPDVVAFRANLGDLSDLTFMSLNIEQTVPTVAESSLWQSTKLAEVIGYYKAYERYANTNFSSLSLPADTSTNQKAYQLQKAILDQLRLAMVYQTKSARYELNPKASNASISVSGNVEIDLATRVRNFSEVSGLLLQIRNAFSQLGFDSELGTWLSDTRDSALFILTTADGLASQSRLYLPQVATDKTSDDVMLGLYGFSDLKPLNDYLTVQRQRASIIAQNYTQAALEYLLNTNSGSSTVQTNTEARWQQTLIELNKYTLKNPNNSITALENVFATSLTLTTDDCMSSETVAPGDDIFTEAHKAFAESIIQYCTQSLDMAANDHYQWVVDTFSQNLAGRFPFADVGTPTTQDASLSAVSDFFTKFNTFSTDLIQQLTQEAETDTSKVAARDFVSQLIDISDFFGSTLAAKPQNGVSSLTVQPYFKLLKTPSADESNIINQGLRTASAAVNLPGDTTQLNWSYGQAIQFDIRFASSSTYKVIQPSTGSGSQSAKFYESGDWALLRLSKRYQTDASSLDLVPNAATKYLNFPVSYSKPVSGADSATTSSTLDVVLGISVMSMDVKTKQLEVLTLPTKFPYTAPPL